MKKLFLTLFLIIGLSSHSYAQSRSFAATAGPRKQFTTIIFAGIGGAVLGLSTLSFHGRPQDHMDDIAIGFAVGIIAGALYTSYQAATNPSDFYGQTSRFQEFIKTDTILKTTSASIEVVQFKYSF